MAANEPLVPLSEIEAEAHWTVRADGAVVADWAGRPAVPVSVAADLFTRAVDERNRLSLERQERTDALSARMRRPAPPNDPKLDAARR